MSNTAASRLVIGAFEEAKVIAAARAALHDVGGKVTCAFVFVSSDYRPHLPDFLELVQLHAHAPIVAGCSGSGLIGSGAEAEEARGFSLLLLHLPETEVQPFAFQRGESESANSPEWWRRSAGLEHADAWIVLADPTNLAAGPWLDEWNAAYPGVPCLGGLASGGERGDDTFLVQDRHLVEGGVAIGFRGGVRVDTIVSQGCRPIGEPLPITGVEQNLVTALGSRPAFAALAAAFEALPEEDKPHARGNLFAGLATSEYVDEFKTGDFLVRNILGADEEQGLIALGAYPRIGQTLQFQLRDRASADADLRRLITAAAKRGARPFASLVFACTGRGQHLFSAPSHDAAVLAERFGVHPSAGFFCNGEIGPVGDRNFIHGYTASVALFS